jgi:type IV pilus assembly protein PilW
MSSPRRSTDAGRRHLAGFTLIELMIGVMIGLLASLAVTHVLVNSEGQKRTTTSGSDAQVNGALALNTLQRSIQAAGYGFAAVPALLGCEVAAKFNGVLSTDPAFAAPGFPTLLAPVTITAGAAGAPDTVRVLASGKTSYSIPLRVSDPAYVAGGTKFRVGSVRSIAAGDLIVASITATAPPGVPCEMFRVSSDPGSIPPDVIRTDDAGWNRAGWPTRNYGEGGVLVNMGAPVDITYSIANNALVERSLKIDSDALGTPSYPAAVEMYPNIVQFQALYGKDTSAPADGTVDVWDKVLPGTPDQWKQVIAVRLVVVARSTQYEKEDVTFANLSWDVGNSGAVDGAAACGTSRCLSIKIDDLPDYTHYRYRVFETIVPLRNMLWNS